MGPPKHETMLMGVRSFCPNAGVSLWDAVFAIVSISSCMLALGMSGYRWVCHFHHVSGCICVCVCICVPNPGLVLHHSVLVVICSGASGTALQASNRAQLPMHILCLM